MFYHRQEEIRARKIGFVSIEGFAFSSSEYVLIDGDMLYDDSLCRSE